METRPTKLVESRRYHLSFLIANCKGDGLVGTARYDDITRLLKGRRGGEGSLAVQSSHLVAAGRARAAVAVAGAAVAGAGRHVDGLVGGSGFERIEVVLEGLLLR